MEYEEKYGMWGFLYFIVWILSVCFLVVFWLCFFLFGFFGSLDISHLVSHSKLLNKFFSENLNF